MEGIYDKKIINSVTHEKDNMFTRFLKRIPLIGRIFRYFFKVEVTITDTIMGVTSGNLVTMLVDLPKVKVVGGNLKEIVDYLKKQ